MKPEDLKGLKIRVQTSPTNVKMLEALGASPTPMSFGEVYTGLQQNVIDGAENNELALSSHIHRIYLLHNLFKKYNVYILYFELLL